MREPVIHQFLKRNNKTACGLPATHVSGTHLCSAVTCPVCKAWQWRVLDATFAPLSDPHPASGGEG